MNRLLTDCVMSQDTHIIYAHTVELIDMAKTYINNFDLNTENENINKRVISDNDYLPFISIKQTLLEMEPGDIVAWPLSKCNSVRLLAGRIQKEKGRIFRCIKNNKQKTIDVCRFS